MSTRLKKLAAALPQGDECANGVKELLRIMSGDPFVRKDSLYSAIAWSTGLTHSEIGALAMEVRSENLGAK